MSIQSKLEALDRFERRADRLIARSEEIGHFGAMRAASSYRLAIAQTRIAYHESLHEGYQVDQLANGIFTAFATIAQEIDIGTPPNIAIRSLQIANRLPYSDDRPYVTAITPQVVWDHIRTFSMKVIGYFPQEAREATLRFRDSSGYVSERIPLLNYSENQLTFRINRASLPNHYHGKMVFSTAQIFIPWIDRLGTRINGIFNVNIGALPPYPATVTFDYQVRRDIAEQRTPFRRQGITVHSQRGPESIGPYHAVGGNNDHDLVSHFTPSHGWRIDLNTLYLHPNRIDGVCSGPTIIRKEEGVVAVRGTTQHKAWGSSGIMLYEVGYQEYIPATWVPQARTDRHRMTRGESKAITLPRGTLQGWNGTIQLYNGTTITISHHAPPPNSIYFTINRRIPGSTWSNFDLIVKTVPIEEIEE